MKAQYDSKQEVAGNSSVQEGDVKQNLVFIPAFQKERDGRVGLALRGQRYLGSLCRA